jgi:hypothetical protein
MAVYMSCADSKVPCDNGTPRDEVDKMLPSLKITLLHWLIKNYTYEDPDTLWPCSDCRLNNVLCGPGMERALQRHRRLSR